MTERDGTQSSFTTLNLSMNSVNSVNSVLDTCRTITYMKPDAMYHPCAFATYGKLLFTLVVIITHV